MTKVWLLQHTHEFEDGHEDVKLIGTYSTRAKAVDAKARVVNQPGFRNRPKGFSINALRVDPENVGWGEGYVTVRPGRSD